MSGRLAPNMLSSDRQWFLQRSGHGIPPAGGQAVGCCKLFLPDICLASQIKFQVSNAVLSTLSSWSLHRRISTLRQAQGGAAQ